MREGGKCGRYVHQTYTANSFLPPAGQRYVLHTKYKFTQLECRLFFFSCTKWSQKSNAKKTGRDRFIVFFLLVLSA